MAQPKNLPYKLTGHQEQVLDTIVENDGCWTTYFRSEDSMAIATLLALGLVEYELEMGARRGTVTVATNEEGGFYLLPVMTDAPL